MKANLNFNRRQLLAATFGFLATSIASPILAQTRIRRIRTQYIAGCCQTNENSHRIAGAALIYALNS